MRTKITYGKKVLAFTEGEVAKVACKGKKMTNDILFEVEGEGGGGSSASLTGTPVPVGEYVERIYFNTLKTEEEVEEVLSKLTYRDITLGGNTNKSNIVWGGTGYVTKGLCITKYTDQETDRYNIVLVQIREDHLSEGYVIYDSYGGWKQDIMLIEDQTYAISYIIPNAESITEFMGVPIGTQNELLKDIISSTPFACKGGSGEVVEVIPEGYIKPEGTLEIVNNGRYYVPEYAIVDVNVEAQGGGDSGGGNSGEVGNLVMSKVSPKISLAINIPMGSIATPTAITLQDISNLFITEGV